MGMLSMASSSEKMPTTKACSASSSLMNSRASSSIKRPRMTAVCPMAGLVVPNLEAVSNKAAQRNSFFKPMIITA
ncbi:hypothetical protein D3C72_2406320 [compost metagenome]